MLMVSSRSIISVLSRRAVLRLGALAAPFAITGARAVTAHAQQGTPAALPDSAVGPEAQSMVQYIHPEKTYFWLPGIASEDVLAGIYGIDVATYDEIKSGYAAAARGAAEELLADASFAEKVDQLPFAPGAKIAVIGESDTDSLQSWFEIVRHLLELRRPDDGIEFINSGVSAMTTTQAFGPFVPLLAQQPDVIVCALGGNDAVRLGPEPNQTLVSLGETIRNLAELRRLASLTTEARWIWLTRMPIDEARMEAYEPFQMGPFAHIWQNADLDAINAWTFAQPELVVDMHAAFGDPVPVEFQEPDGLHPTLAGHQAIARVFVERLAA
jgi:acyl-CoA thioesterase I